MKFSTKEYLNCSSAELINGTTEIINPNINTTINDTLEDKNTYSYFISPIIPSKIYNITDKNTSKYSTDIFNMNNILFKYNNVESCPILSNVCNICII